MTGGRAPFQKFVFRYAATPVFLSHAKNARCFACGRRNVQCRCFASVAAMLYSYLCREFRSPPKGRRRDLA